MLTNMSRRGVLGGLSGLILAFPLRSYARSIAAPDDTIRLGAKSDSPGVDLNAWVRIAPDDTVYLRFGAAEMGQGVFTGLCMLIAEELEVDWSKVQAESAPAHKDYRRELVSTPGKAQLTGGSESTTGYWTILREAGATAREMLIAEAAERWGVAPSACRAEKGVVKNGDKSFRYGELAEAAGARSPSSSVVLKEPGQFRLIGTDVARLDLPPKVNGTATFGIDIRRPGQLAATLMACPHFGGTLFSFDDTAARGMPGVVDVFSLDERVVVVVAQHVYQARQGLNAVSILWKTGEWGALDDAGVRSALNEALDKGGDRVAQHGSRVDLEAGEAGVVEATYWVPYLDHAPIEPLNATVHVQPDRVDVWIPTQAQGLTQRSVAKRLGRSQSEVFVHTTLLGGGFGRKSFFDFAELAAAVAERFDVPVQLLWSREECFAHGFYRPAMLCRQRARLGADGMPEAWLIELSGQGPADNVVPGFLARLDVLEGELVAGGFPHMPYAVPDLTVKVAHPELPIPVGWWRSVHGSHNGFFREAFLDELAAAAGQEPLAYRMKLLKDNPRELKVLQTAVDAAGPLVAGRSRGVALFESFGSIVAQVADVTVDSGKLRVHRVGAAIDCGRAVLPDSVISQVEGSIGMGLSAMMREGLSLSQGAVTNRNFHEYRLLMMSEMPEIEVRIIESGEAMGGVGEPGLPPIAGAVANALYGATRQRLRSLPIGGDLAG